MARPPLSHRKLVPVSAGFTDCEFDPVCFVHIVQYNASPVGLARASAQRLKIILDRSPTNRPLVVFRVRVPFPAKHERVPRRRSCSDESVLTDQLL